MRARGKVRPVVLPRLLIQSVAHAQMAAPPLPFLHSSGPSIVNEKNEPVLLHGCNFGNWLLLEPWMLELSGNLRDQLQIEKMLTDRKAQTAWLLVSHNVLLRLFRREIGDDF